MKQQTSDTAGGDQVPPVATNEGQPAAGDVHALKLAQESAVYADLLQKRAATIEALKELQAEKAALPAQIQTAALAGDSGQLAQLGQRQMLLPALILQAKIGAEQLWIEATKQNRVVASLKLVPLRAEYDALEKQKEALNKRQGQLSYQMGNLKASSSGPIDMGRLHDLQAELNRLANVAGAPVVRSLPHALP